MMVLLELSHASGRRNSKSMATETEIIIPQLLFRHSALQLLDPKTRGQPMQFRCNHAYKPRYMSFHTNVQLLAAIFDLSLIQTSDSICISPVVLPDPENMDIAVGIQLLLPSCVQAKIHIFQVCMPPSWIFHFLFLPVWSRNIATNPIVQLDPENIGITVGISLLSCVQAEICVFQV